MRTPLPPLVLAAVASSAATLGLMELTRARPTAVAVDAAEGSTGTTARVSPPPRSRDAGGEVPTSTPDVSALLADLERRIAELELEAPEAEAATDATAPDADNAEAPTEHEEFRQQVLEWIAEVRAAEVEAARRAAADRVVTKMEWDAKFTAYMLAVEHELADWQKERLAEALLAIEERRREIDAGVDARTADPDEVEALYLEFDEWSEEQLMEALGKEEYERIWGAP